jgi:hypothetical protein
MLFRQLVWHRHRVSARLLDHAETDVHVDRQSRLHFYLCDCADLCLHSLLV